MKTFRFRLGEATVTIASLAIYFFGIGRAWGDLWLPVALVSAAVLFPAYLVSLLMWRHYFWGQLEEGQASGGRALSQGAFLQAKGWNNALPES